MSRLRAIKHYTFLEIVFHAKLLKRASPTIFLFFVQYFLVSSLNTSQAGGPGETRNIKVVGVKGNIKAEKAKRATGTGGEEVQSQGGRLSGQGW